MVGNLKFKLYENSKNDYENLKNIEIDFLKNRNVQNLDEYLTITGIKQNPDFIEKFSDILNQNYTKLDDISDAVQLFLDNFNKKNKIQILVDEDVDGFCSAAMMYSYIKKCDPDYPVHYILHNHTKAHGIQGLDDDVFVDEDTKLLIIPDAGTNDTEQCKILKERGVSVLILDHHEKSKENPYAIIVNNQISNEYANKNFCGAGIVYKFLKAVDDKEWNEYADDFLDLVAFANISDVMDMRELETRFYVEVGLHSIKSKFMAALIKAQEFSMGGIVNVHSVQWFLTPVVNACIRFGTAEEKELMFKAFIEQDEWFEYKKRATKDKPSEVIQESIYDRAARLAKNAKSRQDKSREKCVQMIYEEIGENPTDKVIIQDISGIVDGGLTGVCAIKVAERYNRPCLLLNKHRNSETGDLVYGGSGRNVNHSPIENFRSIVESNGQFNFAQGHPSAFGIEIPIENVENAKKIFNQELKDENFEKVYLCDYIIPECDIDENVVYEMTKFNNLLGQGIEEPMVAITDLEINRDNITIQGKNSDSYYFMINDIKFVQFRCRDNNSVMEWLNDSFDNIAKINLVGHPSINEYQGIKTLQFVIEDVDVLKTFFEDSEDNVEEDDESW